MGNHQNVLIFCPNWVGDLVMATPTLGAIRVGYHQAKIYLLLKPPLRSLIEDLPFFDEIIEYNGFLSTLRRLREKEIELALLLPNSFGSALLTWLSGAKRRVGYNRDLRGWLLTDRVEVEKEGKKFKPIPMVEYYLTLCNYLGLKIENKGVELRVSISKKKKAEELLKNYGVEKKGLIIAIIPGAAFGSAKCWGEENFVKVSQGLIKRYNCHILILPGPGEEEMAQGIEEKIPCKERVVNFSNPPLPLGLLSAVIAQTSLVITNDCGPRHIAVALQKPVVAIIGPTDPRYSNYDLQRSIILRSDLECSPCHLKVCPTDHRCMTSITPEMVLKASEDLIRKYL